jgi:iron only hydrogenase large subunit-like protein
MPNYFHSVTLDEKKCQGCTNCIKRCPVEAIRVHHGKAKIIEERCIDCGECIRCCPNHAKIGVTDTLQKLSDFEYRIVLPAPSFFAQVREEKDLEKILQAFLGLGFDEVFEVALAAEVVSYMVASYLAANSYKKPLISSACPATLRRMQIKFPDLLEQVIPVMTPMEVAARLAKEDAVRRTSIPYERIGAFFITPCPAKVTEVRQPLHVSKSAVDGVIAASAIYKELVRQIAKIKGETTGLRRATSTGLAWGYLTGEARAIGYPLTLSVGGVQNAISVFEEIGRGELKNVDFVEVQACEGGCVGGSLNIQNMFVARINLKNMVGRYKSKDAYFSQEELKRFCSEERFRATEAILPRPIMTLDDDVSKALVKMERIDKIAESLPGLDCGACGSPSCRALAEDIIRGIAFDTDCVVNLRERVKTLAEEILDLARKLPQTMSKEQTEADRKDDDKDFSCA